MNKKLISIFVCLLTSLFIYAESGTLDVFDSICPHEDFVINSNHKTNKYRIQMQRPFYAYYVDAKSCSIVECFPNLEMGIVPMRVSSLSVLNTENPSEKKYLPVICNSLYIFPDIIMKNENLKDVFSIGGITRQEGGYLYNCVASYWEIYEKGIVLDVVYERKLNRVYLKLKEDGKYYEVDDTENFGELKEKYLGADFFHKYFDNMYRKYFSYDGCSLYKIDGIKKIESVLVDEITFYNQTENGIEFITPYGCGFFNFQTESVSLVPKEKYIGKEFTYLFILDNHDYKGKKARKIITEADLNPPDIRIPLEERHKWKIQ